MNRHFPQLEKLAPLYLLPEQNGQWRVRDYKKFINDLERLLPIFYHIDFSVFLSPNPHKDTIEYVGKALNHLLENEDKIRVRLFDDMEKEKGVGHKKRRDILEKLSRYWSDKLADFDYYFTNPEDFLTINETAEIASISDKIEKELPASTVNADLLNAYFGRIRDRMADEKYHKYLARISRNPLSHYVLAEEMLITRHTYYAGFRRRLPFSAVEFHSDKVLEMLSAIEKNPGSTQQYKSHIITFERLITQRQTLLDKFLGQSFSKSPSVQRLTHDMDWNDKNIIIEFMHQNISLALEQLEAKNEAAALSFLAPCIKAIYVIKRLVGNDSWTHGIVGAVYFLFYYLSENPSDWESEFLKANSSFPIKNFYLFDNPRFDFLKDEIDRLSDL